MKTTIGIMFFAAYNLGFSVATACTWIYQEFMPKIIIYVWVATLISSCLLIVGFFMIEEIKKYVKISFGSTYRQMKSTTPFWWLMTPSIKRYWYGQLIYIGTRSLYMILDFRGMNSMQDFADALSYPKIWNILKRFKRK